MKFGSLREELARQLHISSSQVSKLQHISSSAAPEIQEAVAEGSISINTANEIAKLEPEHQQVLAEGDLRTVTPKAIRSAAVNSAADDPKDLCWDGKTLSETIRHQLMRLISEPLHDAAIKMDSVDFVNQFSGHCRTVNLPADDGISVNCGNDRITVSFSNPAEYRNIRSIWLAWRTAGKYVQTWIREKLPDKQKTEKVDTPVTFSRASQEMIPYSAMPQSECDHIFDTGCFNEIVLGYMTLTLQSLGLSTETVHEAQKAMNGIFDQSDASEARDAYIKYRGDIK